MKRTTSGYLVPFRHLKLLLLLVCALACVPLHGQERTIRLATDEMTVAQAIEQIEAQSGLIIGVNHNNFDVSRTFRPSGEVLPVEGLLEEIVADSGHTYLKQGKHVIIIARQPAPAVAAAQNPEEAPKLPRYVPAPERTYDTPAGPKEPLTISYIDIYGETRSEPITFSTDDPSEFYRTGEKLPVFAIKANLLHGAATLTPNIGIEFGLGRRTTMEIMYGWNRWNLRGTVDDNKKLVHTYVQPEFRWWLCERFNGHFLGVHALGANYNISGHDIKVPMVGFEKGYRYQGYALGAGLSYGYSVMLSRVMGLEFTVGGGLLWLKYDRYACGKCETASESFTKTGFSITKAGVSLVFIIK